MMTAASLKELASADNASASVDGRALGARLAWPLEILALPPLSFGLKVVAIVNRAVIAVTGREDRARITSASVSPTGSALIARLASMSASEASSVDGTWTMLPVVCPVATVSSEC